MHLYHGVLSIRFCMAINLNPCAHVQQKILALLHIPATSPDNLPSINHKMAELGLTSDDAASLL